MKLLNRTVRYYLLYAGIVLLVAIPILYFIIQGIVKEDVDESLLAHKEQLVKKINNMPGEVSFTSAEAIESGLSIIPGSTSQMGDSLYSLNEYDSISKENIPYRVLQSTVVVKNSPYTIRLKNSLLDSRDLIETIVLVMAILLLLVIAGLIIITRRISKKVWKPFYKTVDKLHHYRVDKDEVLSFEKTSVDEFTDLNKTITALVQRNRKAYQSQKEFTENASHEMQTPLAVFQHKLELLMQTNPITPEQAELMEQLDNTSQRMNRLNKSLLLLTKIDNNQFVDTETVSLKSIIEKLLEQYKFQADIKNIVVNFDLEQNKFLTVNKSLLEILVSNLLINAIRYTDPGGRVDIALSGKELIIENTATGNGLDKSRLFQRFQKQAADGSSNGLGLEIAGKIATLYQLVLSYRFENNRHIFSLQYGE